VRNEFAAVRVELDLCGNDPRLKITDLESGASILMDASLLHSLVYMPRSLIDEITRASIVEHRGTPPSPRKARE
jgi:hypothetical protein